MEETPKSNLVRVNGILILREPGYLCLTIQSPCSDVMPN